jgi:CubicO group peptidase (beta-lactamase class C family)
MFSGSVVVVQDGEITASAHAGYENREAGKLNSAESLYSVASVGKMFTAVAIAQLVEAGKLAYETPVPEAILELEDQINAAITVDHLLHHTSGLTRMSGIDDDVLDAIQNNSDYFALVLSTGIRSAGPREFAYRNANYFVLGEIIERVSGQAYETYIRDHVGIPAGMSGPFFIRRDRAGAQRVSKPYLAVDFQTWWDSEEPIVANNVDEFVHAAPVVTPAAGGCAWSGRRTCCVLPPR